MDNNTQSSVVNTFTILLFISIMLIISNFLGFTRILSSTLGRIVIPIAIFSNSAGSQIHTFSKSFSEVRSLRKEYNQLIIEKAGYEADRALIKTLFEENIALKSQLNVSDGSEKYIEARVMSFSTDVPSGSLLLNIGKKDGVTKGDIAVVGNSYVGLITEVSEHSSKLRLPTNRASNIEVLVINKSSIDVKAFLDGEVEYQKENYEVGVAAGTQSSIKVENLDVKADLALGYYVITSDPEIGRYLYLGEVIEVLDDPSSASKEAFILSPLNFNELTTVFIIDD